MDDPVFSFICPAARPHNWAKIVDQVKVQQVSFEWVFVGPNPPVTTLEPNVRYVYSQIKPHQAHMLAATLARGKLLCYWNDDWTMQIPLSVTRLVQEWEALHDEEGIVAPEMTGSHPYLFFAKREGYVLPFGDVFSKEAFLRNGGYDKRFIGIYASNDYAIRMQAAGHPVKILANIPLIETGANGLWDELWDHDRSFLDWLWMEGYRWTMPRDRTFDNPPKPLLKVRHVAVESYDWTREDFAYVHQGPHGRWRDTCRTCWEGRVFPCAHVSAMPADLQIDDVLKAL